MFCNKCRQSGRQNHSKHGVHGEEITKGIPDGGKVEEGVSEAEGRADPG